MDQNGSVFDGVIDRGTAETGRENGGAQIALTGEKFGGTGSKRAGVETEHVLEKVLIDRAEEGRESGVIKGILTGIEESVLIALLPEEREGLRTVRDSRTNKEPGVGVKKVVRSPSRNPKEKVVDGSK